MTPLHYFSYIFQMHEENQTQRAIVEKVGPSNILRASHIDGIVDNLTIDEGVICLDPYDSDLSLSIDYENLLKAEPNEMRIQTRDQALESMKMRHRCGGGLIAKGAFSTKFHENNVWDNIWSGIRASYGVSSGRVFFEVKLLEICDERTNTGIMIGWSTNDSDLLLGHDETSYAFSNKAGKKINN